MKIAKWFLLQIFIWLHLHYFDYSSTKNIYLILPCLIWKLVYSILKRFHCSCVFNFRINIYVVYKHQYKSTSDLYLPKLKLIYEFYNFVDYWLFFLEFYWPVCWRWQRWSQHDSGPPLHDYLNVLMNYKHSILMTGKQS